MPGGSAGARCSQALCLSMGTHAKVLNVTSNMHIKRSQALRRIDQCISTWVDSFTIRDLSLAERVHARSQKARLEEALAFAELPGLKFQPPAYAQESTRREYALAAEANKFVIECLP